MKIRKATTRGGGGHPGILGGNRINSGSSCLKEFPSEVSRRGDGQHGISQKLRANRWRQQNSAGAPAQIVAKRWSQDSFLSEANKYSLLWREEGAASFSREGEGRKGERKVAGS